MENIEKLRGFHLTDGLEFDILLLMNASLKEECVIWPSN